MGTPIPLNGATFVVKDIVTITGGVLVAANDAVASETIASVSTDTRTLTPGSLFVALPGERFDGHDYLATAAQNGARVALVERDVTAPEGLTLIRVPSTLAALRTPTPA